MTGYYWILVYCLLQDTLKLKVALQSSGLTGVCMAASYSVEGDPGLAVVAMWSQPYDLNLHSAYTAAGVTRNRARYAVIL